MRARLRVNVGGEPHQAGPENARIHCLQRPRNDRTKAHLRDDVALDVDTSVYASILLSAASLTSPGEERAREQPFVREMRRTEQRAIADGDFFHGQCRSSSI